MHSRKHMQRAWKSTKSMKYWKEIARCRQAARSVARMSGSLVRRGRTPSSGDVAQQVYLNANALLPLIDRILIQLDHIDDRLTRIEAAAISADIIKKQDIETIATQMSGEFVL